MDIPFFLKKKEVNFNTKKIQKKVLTFLIENQLVNC